MKTIITQSSAELEELFKMPTYNNLTVQSYKISEPMKNFTPGIEIVYRVNLTSEESGNISINRKYALLKCLEAMANKANEIYHLLNDTAHWDNGLQERITTLCPDNDH